MNVPFEWFYMRSVLQAHVFSAYVCNRVGLRGKGVGDMTGWLCSSVVECSHGQRKTLSSSHNCSPVAR